MVASDSFGKFLREQPSPLGHIAMRRMFGKTGVFCDGVMLGMVQDDALYFRVNDDSKAAFQEAADFPPLNYAKKAALSISPSGAPERLFDDPDEFLAWARIALAAARRVTIERERTSPRGKSKPREA